MCMLEIVLWCVVITTWLKRHLMCQDTMRLFHTMKKLVKLNVALITLCYLIGLISCKSHMHDAVLPRLL